MQRAAAPEVPELKIPHGVWKMVRNSPRRGSAVREGESTGYPSTHRAYAISAFAQEGKFSVDCALFRLVSSPRAVDFPQPLYRLSCASNKVACPLSISSTALQETS